ncbi:septum formation family protein [Actinomadura welshii]
MPGRTNRLAIAALVTGLLGLVLLAVGFAIAALVQTGRRREKGKGLALGALVASGVWTVVAAIMAATAVTSTFSVDRDDGGRVTKSGKVLGSALREGDCFTGGDGAPSGFVTALPCTEPHDGEVIATPTLPAEPYPGDETVDAAAAQACYQRGLYLQKSRRVRDLNFFHLWPDELRWADGDRRVTCAVRYTGPGTLTTPLRETVDTGLKTVEELSVGDCIENWNTSTPVLPVISCDEPHEFQVYGEFQTPMGGTYALGDYPPYPGEAKVEKQAARRCAKQARKVFAKNPPPVPVDGMLVWPREEDWFNGNTQVLCLVKGLRGPLKRSVVPR